jgi:hypothetical protein
MDCSARAPFQKIKTGQAEESVWQLEIKHVSG